MKRVLGIDIETFSDVDLIKCGVYAYADSPAFEVLLFAYSFDGEETEIIDLAQGEVLPAEVEAAIFDEGIVKTAFNVNFERTCLSKYFGRQLSPKSWHCSAVQAAMLALPRSLEDVGAVLGLERQKMKEGKELIRYFCVPCKPTKANGGRTRNLPCHAPEKWELFKTYCKRDVDVEKAVRYKLRNFPIPETEMEVYRLDQEINDRGVLVDRKLVEQAVAGDLLHKEIVTKRAYELTGLENPNSVAQIKGWLGGKGVEIDSLSKKAVAEMIEETDGEVRYASRILLKVTEGPYRTEEDIYKLAKSFRWEQYFTPENTFKIELSSRRSPLKSVAFAALRVKDAVCDYFRETDGQRPDVEKHDPDIRIYVHLTDKNCIIYLDTSGESLFKRGWREAKGEAPLKENLASGLLGLAGWTPDTPLHLPED